MGLSSSFNEFCINNSNDYPTDILCIIDAIQKASLQISNKLSSGLMGVKNVQKEDVTKLDIISNELYFKKVEDTGVVFAFISEEIESITFSSSWNSKKRKLVLAIDPLDGSSNIDCGNSVGSIFAIYEASTDSSGNLKIAELTGHSIVAAGYILFGTYTYMAFSIGKNNPVLGFFLCPNKNQYLLINSDVKCPNSGSIYSINEANAQKWNSNLYNFLNQRIKLHFNGSLRYSGAFVADIHRILMVGGVFIYPANVKTGLGKLRLLYECAPISFLFRNAGGMAIAEDCEEILSIIPTSIHQKTSILIGSKELVCDYISNQ